MTLVNKLKLYFRYFRAFFPSKLPQGLTAFTAWSDDIIDLYGFPDNDSMRFAVAATVVHIREGRAYIPKRYFGLILMKGAATQIAGQVMQDLKAKQKATEEASKLQVVPNESPKT